MSAFNAFSSISSALMDIDSAPGVAFQAGVEEAGRILQGGPLGEGHFHDALVRLAGADDPAVRPHRNPSPLPLLDDVGVGLLDETSNPGQRLAPPIAQFLDPRIDQPRGRASVFSCLRGALRLLHGAVAFFVVAVTRSPLTHHIVKLSDGPT